MKAKFVRSEKANRADAVSFYFKTESRVSFTAGQFIELSLSKHLRHWFTISSSPREPEVRITTRLTGSDYKNSLNSLKKGQEVYMTDPMGDFVLPIDSSIPIVFVAAGIGITPYLSILGDLDSNNSIRDLHLIYAAKTEDDFIDVAKYDDSGLLATFTKVTGPLRVELILDELSNLASPYVYISGPELLVEKLVSEIRDTGFSESNLIADYFPGYS